MICLPKIIDGKDGILCVAEQNKNIPFEIKRVFFIYDFKENSAIRGKHAHRRVKQALFCIKGSFEILLDDGKNKQVFELQEPHKGIYIGTYVWNVMTKFSDDCIILVFASENYDEKEYIRNYEKFLSEIKQLKKTF